MFRIEFGRASTAAKDEVMKSITRSSNLEYRYTDTTFAGRLLIESKDKCTEQSCRKAPETSFSAAIELLTSWRSSSTKASPSYRFRPAPRGRRPPFDDISNKNRYVYLQTKNWRYVQLATKKYIRDINMNESLITEDLAEKILDDSVQRRLRWDVSHVTYLCDVCDASQNSWLSARFLNRASDESFPGFYRSASQAKNLLWKWPKNFQLGRKNFI